ncbi:hypothetical protein BU23DRAFT_212647 [Bimuria novae-zelandiae CBS 107.79]|uniref:Uncharacterized protein n=1 Tax=Bimuria novae-zelandiae CBS 107.79 TaxID=1447943 RepID=A0A6A5V089_9PLEO|nr:hypothetical protein BU23DRAFT_212647 [Bimuria novae-zelandiae CBS 107.79]
MRNENQLMNAMALNGGSVVASGSPVNESSKVRDLLDVKQLVLANARVLYGSESRKFFDFVTGSDTSGKYVCVLICSLDGYTRILRKETHTDPLEAARALANGLIKDAGTLFTKVDIGDQLIGQQGYREEDGKFKLDEYKPVQRFSGPVDDTKTLRPEYRHGDRSAPRGPAADVKRRRYDGLY